MNTLKIDKIYGIKGTYQYIDEDTDCCTTWFCEKYETHITKEEADKKVIELKNKFKKEKLNFDLDIYFSVDKNVKVDNEDDLDFFAYMDNILDDSPYKWISV